MLPDCCVVVVIIADVDIVVVVAGCDDAVAVMVVSRFLGARITNFNSKERVTANIVRMIKDMQMILTYRYCHHLRSSIFFETLSLYSGFGCILCPSKNLN